MYAHYFLNHQNRPTFYIPGNMAVLKKEGRLEVQDSPVEIQAMDSKFRHNPKTLFAPNTTPRRIVVDDKDVKEFQDYCFKDMRILAECKAREMYQNAEAEIVKRGIIETIVRQASSDSHTLE